MVSIPHLMTMMMILMIYSSTTATVTAAEKANWKFNVIGAGYGRTGTDSLRIALTHLGIGPVHHMYEVMRARAFGDWVDVAFAPDEKTKQDKLREIMINGGFHSSVDFPSASYYESLMHVFPDAKVILSVRDTPMEWVKSAKSSILVGSECKKTSVFENGRYFMCPGLRLVSFFLKPVMHTMERMLEHTTAHFGDLTDDNLARVYSQHVANVTRIVPAHKLLIFNAKQGWDPLVKFLGIPKPDVPFPRSNDSVAFQRMLIAMASAGYVMLLVFLGMTWMFVRFLARTFTKSSNVDNLKKRE